MNKSPFYFSKWRFQAKKFDDILRVKSKTAIKNLFIRFRLIAGGSLSIRFVKEAQVLAMKLGKVRREQGVKGLTLYLKSSSVCFQQALAGYRIDNVTLVGPRVSRTATGLPRIIPRSHRLIIVNRKPGCYFLMKYYLSVFYLYRVLVFPGKLKLETITAPGTDYDETFYQPYLEIFSDLILKRTKIKPLDFIKSKVKIFPIFRSSPFTSSITYNPFKKVKAKSGKRAQLWSTNVISLIDATRAVMSNPLFPLFKEFIDILQFRKLSDFINYQRGMKISED